MRKSWATGAAIAVCLALGGMDAVAVAPSPSAPAAVPAGAIPTIEIADVSIRPFGLGFVTVAYFAVDANDDLILPGGTDGAALVKLSPKGEVLATWAGLEVVPGQPDTISGIALDLGNGDIWASDLTADRVVHLDADLQPVGSWGETGAEPGRFFGPGGLALDAAGNVVVADLGNDRIQTFRPDGTLLRVIEAPGGKTVPVDVAIDPTGDLLVSTVQPPLWAGLALKLAPDGTVLLQMKPTSAPDLLYPNVVADATGNLLIGDAWNGLIRLDATGKQLGTPIAVPGSGTSAFAVRVAPSGDVYTLACQYQSSDCTLTRMTPDGAPLAQWHAATPPTLLGGKVDVGDHQLYLQCVGAGSPTIVWEAGLYGSGWVGTQQYLMGKLAPTTRFCVSERRGQALSDPSPEDDFLHWWGHVDDLHALLQAGGIEGPYVMAGYSFGGLLARLYAYAYPTEVAGLLAVDPSHEDQFSGPVDPDAPLGITTCSDVSCPVYEDIERVHAMTGGTVAGFLGDLPLVVLSHDPDVPFSSSPEYEAQWLQQGSDTVTASSNALHVASSWSGHAIPYAHPGLVIEALEQLVAAARASDHTLAACGTTFTHLGGVCQ